MLKSKSKNVVYIYLLTSGSYTLLYWLPSVLSIKHQDLHAVGENNRDIKI